MPKHKSLIVSSAVVTAGRKRKCYHSPSHSILKGEACLEIKDGMQSPQGYCAKCAEVMIQNGLDFLIALRNSL